MSKKIFILRNTNVVDYACDYLRSLEINDVKPKKVVIDELTRNNEQNALMWSLLECFSKQLQWVVNGQLVYLDSEEWKDILSAAFKNETQRIAMGLDGGMVMLGMRTSKMTKPEFSEFIEFIYSVGAERNVKLSE